MEIVYKKTSKLKPYENNPRFNDDAVEYVANSIKEFGFLVPIIVDSNDVIVAGHTRWKASLELNIKEIPCIVADDLSEEKIRMLRLADNKVAEISVWDYERLQQEILALEDYKLDLFDIEKIDIDFVNGDEVIEEVADKPIKDCYLCPHCKAVIEKERLL